MPFNNNFGNPNFATNYRQLQPLQGNVPLDAVSQLGPAQQVGPGNVPPLNNRVAVPPINPGMASVGPSPEMLNKIMNQPLPVPNQGPPQGMNPMMRQPMPPVPVGNQQQPMKRPMFPTANGRMGY